MRDGIDARSLTPNHEYAAIVNTLSQEHDVSPLLVYAIRLNETSEGSPADEVSGDDGRGVMQLTSSYPPNWQDPATNIRYAIEQFIAPDWEDAVEQTGLQGEGLVRFIAAAYNAGYETALLAHARGDVDAVTTDRYGERAVAHYLALLAEAEAAPPVPPAPSPELAARAGDAAISWSNHPVLDP